jgi:hypothetical protein
MELKKDDVTLKILNPEAIPNVQKKIAEFLIKYDCLRRKS